MAYSLDPSTDSCYEGTTCLVNKFDIRDEVRLSEVEAQITFAKAALLEDNLVDVSFGFSHFKKIHEFLFCDLYDWAGKTRTVNISKKKTKFADFKLIEEIGNKLFSKVENGYLSNLSFDSFVERIANLYNDINNLHPFREGNGRTQRIYFTQLIRHYGYDINFSEVDVDFLMIATIKASQGINDFLIDFFREAIVKIDFQK